MSYRDDHDAALARAAVLEREVARLTDIEREATRQRARADAAEQTLARLQPSPAVRARRKISRARAVMFGAIVLLFGGVLLTVGATAGSRTLQPTWPPPVSAR